MQVSFDEEGLPKLPFTYELKFPILVDGEVVLDKITISREPVIKDLYGVQITKLDDLANMATIISRLTGEARPVIDRMKFQDFKEIFGVVERFLSYSPQTGNDV
jgi:hypothetical protein